jgi:SHS2 domain-containing protein
MPYRFLDDIATADVAFEVWGTNREELFVAAAEALLRTMVDDPVHVLAQEELPIVIEQQELDLLLFDFLNELVYLKDARKMLLHVPTVRIESEGGGFALHGTARGEGLDPRRHHLQVDVKAATLHRLQVWREGEVWRATVVLDV